MDEKMFGQTLFFLLTFSTDKENTAEGWASSSQHFCAIFHHPGWKDGRMIKSPFLFNFHIRWYETPIQVWEAKLDEWNMLPVWETGLTKQLIKLNKPNSRAQISTAARRSSLRLYLNYQGWVSHSRAAVWAVMAVGNLHCGRAHDWQVPSGLNIGQSCQVRLDSTTKPKTDILQVTGSSLVF